MALRLCTDVMDRSFVLSFEGTLGEDAIDLLNIEVDPSLDLRLNLEALTGINSIGIKYFYQWIHRIQSKRIVLNSCPRGFVHQLNMVHGFIPERAEIQSFYVIYYSEVTDSEVERLFVRGVDFEVVAGEIVVLAKDILDSQGNPMELEDLGGKYFRFLSIYG